MKRAFQSAAARTQQADGHGNSLDALGDLLTTEQAAARLCYTGRNAVKNFFKWADRNRVPRLHVGSRVRWQAHVLAAFLKDDKWTRNRHGRIVAHTSTVHQNTTVESKAGVR